MDAAFACHPNLRGGYGQIYVGAVNWLLMIATLGLTIGFRKSDNLAAAYGIAVSLTMLLTSVLLFIAMREIWGWSPVKAGAVVLVFLVVDFGFFTANVTKVLEGGYVPLLLAAAIYGVSGSGIGARVPVPRAGHCRSSAVEKVR